MIATKFAVFLGVLALALINGVSCTEQEERIKAIYAKCKEETQAEDSEIDAFRRMEIPNSGKGKCMMGCLMREASIIVNGRFSKDGALRVAERYYSDNQEDLEKAKVILDVCEKGVGNETDECEIAGKLASCIIEEAQKANLTTNLQKMLTNTNTNNTSH